MDLAFNLLCKIDETIENLVKLKNLKNLILLGNPFSLLRPYKGYVLSQLKILRYFDGEKVNFVENLLGKTDARSPLKKQFSLNMESNKSQQVFFFYSFYLEKKNKGNHY